MTTNRLSLRDWSLIVPPSATFLIFRNQWGYLFNNDPGSFLFVSPPPMTPSSYCHRRCRHVSGIDSSSCGSFPSGRFPQRRIWRYNESPREAGAFLRFLYPRTGLTICIGQITGALLNLRCADCLYHTFQVAAH